jgi:hypothetical protein
MMQPSLVESVSPAKRQEPAKAQSFSPRLFPLRTFALPAMALLFGLYVLLHSPLRDATAALFRMDSRGCYFCLGSTAWTGLIDPLAAVVLISSALLAAWALAGQFDAGHYEQTLAFGLLALAFVAVPAAIIGVFGDRLRLGLLLPPAGPLVCTVPSILTVVICLRGDWRLRFGIRLAQTTNLVSLFWGLGLFLCLAIVIASLTHPPTGGDALSYHAPLAVFLWQDGNLGAFLDRAPGIWALAHPGTAELWFGLLRLLGGEALADLGQLPFAFLGSAAVAAFARRLGLRRGAALLAAGSYLLVPMLVLQSGTQANDVVGAGLLMATMALASAPLREWGYKRLALIGLGLGLVATTKLALLPGVAAVGLFISGVLLWEAKRRGNLLHLAAKLALVGMIGLVVVSPWWMRNVVRYGNPLYPSALPLLGRGVNVHDFGPIDTSFVPGTWAWPIYPLLEAHDDRSGFGALVAVGVAVGFLFAARRSRKHPLRLFLLTAAITLPLWWIMTLHEPRFFLALVGLALGFLPWSLAATLRRWRRPAAFVLAATALFSALVTLDQGILTLVRLPDSRVAFYDRTWAVDPFVTELPENEGILNNTGYAPTIFEYTAIYPLLGPSQQRLVIPVDWEDSIEVIIARMRSAGVRYVYIAASPDNRQLVESKYGSGAFELVHQSFVVPGEINGARRTLYRAATDDEIGAATVRYLYELR